MRNRKFMARFLIAALTLGLLFAANVYAGDIVPGLDDATAYIDLTVDQVGATTGDMSPIEGPGTITFAARFNAAQIDINVSSSGPVVILEVGGTTYGNGLYIADGNLIFVSSGANAVGARFAIPTSLNDTDASDGAVVVTIGPVTAGVDTEVYAALNANTGELITSLNGVPTLTAITGTVGSANLTGNESVGFVPTGALSYGNVGGLTEGVGADPLVFFQNAQNFTGSSSVNQRGQIFAEVPPLEVWAHTPSPANGATAVDPGVVTSLSWYTAEDPDNPGAQNPDVTGHFLTVYHTDVNGDPNFDVPADYETFVAAGTDPISASYAFALDDVVHWRVEEQINSGAKGSAGNIIGPLWSFEALPSVPNITGQPADVLSFPATDPAYEGSVVFECAFFSKTTATAEWYRASDPDNPISDADADITIDLVADGQVYTSTLTIANVDRMDEDVYSCRPANISGSSDSDPANLAVKRLVGWWPLDLATQFTDMSGEDHNAVPYVAPDPSQWVPGVDPAETNEGLDLVPEPLSAADAGSWEPSEFSGQMTLSAWVYWVGANGVYQGVVTKRNQEDPAAESWYFEVNPTGNLQLGGGGINQVSAPMPGSGQWIHVAATASPSGIALYINGAVVDTANGSTLAQTLATIKLGANNTKLGVPEPPFNGVLDDVRIYNYALSEAEMALLYYDVLEIPVCIDTEMRFDANGDCIVNLKDFATFVTNWLACGLHPVEECPW